MDGDAILSLTRLWPIFLGFVIFVLWLGRLEYTGKRNREDQQDTKDAIVDIKKFFTKLIDEMKGDLKDDRKERREAVTEVHRRIDELRNMINGNHH